MLFERHTAFNQLKYRYKYNRNTDTPGPDHGVLQLEQASRLIFIFVLVIRDVLLLQTVSKREKNHKVKMLRVPA